MKVVVVWAVLALAVCGQSTVSVLVRAALVNDRLDQKPVPLLQVHFQPAAGGAGVTATTGFSGRVRVRLQPGPYTLTTPTPVTFDGASYRWRLTLTIAGASQEIDLSNANAQRTVIAPSPKKPKQPSARRSLTARFEHLRTSVVTVWTDLDHGSGFIVSPDGLVLTNDHVVMGADFVAVQFDPSHKVRAIVLAEDHDRDVAVLRVNLQAFPQATVAQLASAQALAAIHPGESVFTMASPLEERKILTSGIISGVQPQTLLSGITINPGNSGGPLFDAEGSVIGITAFSAWAGSGPGVSGILKISQAWPALAQARVAVQSDAAPSAALLPMVPSVPYPLDALQKAATGKYKPGQYRFGEGGFDVQVITPPLRVWLSDHRAAEAAWERKHHSRDRRAGPAFDPAAEIRQDNTDARALVEIDAVPKIRPTKLTLFLQFQRFARVPLHLRYTADFERMQLFCGARVITPVMPVKAVVGTNSSGRRDRIYGFDDAFQGVYRYGPDAFNPACGTMRLRIYSSFGKPVRTKTLNPKLVARVWRDLAPWRAAQRISGSADQP